jgi:hypothetical protein
LAAELLEIERFLFGSSIRKEYLIPSVSARASLHCCRMTHADDIRYTGTGATLTEPAHPLSDEVVTALARLLRELRFGSIEIVVHDGRITQIERREKVRITAAGLPRGE